MSIEKKTVTSEPIKSEKCIVTSCCDYIYDFNEVNKDIHNWSKPIFDQKNQIYKPENGAFLSSINLILHNEDSSICHDYKCIKIQSSFIRYFGKMKPDPHGTIYPILFHYDHTTKSYISSFGKDEYKWFVYAITNPTFRFLDEFDNFLDISKKKWSLELILS